MAAKTQHFGKVTGFTAFDENHGFRDFRDFLLTVPMALAGQISRLS